MSLREILSSYQQLLELQDNANRERVEPNGANRNFAERARKIMDSIKTLAIVGLCALVVIYSARNMFPAKNELMPGLQVKVMQKFHGTFIVMGAAGSGKTTLIEYLTHASFEEIFTEDIGAQSDTKTQKVELKNIFMENETHAWEYDFYDTIEDIYKKLFLSILKNGHQRINGLIFCFKMGRMTSTTKKAILSTAEVFKRLKISKNNTVFIITHGMMYKRSIQERFENDLFNHLKEVVHRHNVVSVNMMNINEVEERFRPLVLATAIESVEKAHRLLHSFKSPIVLNRIIFTEEELQRLAEKSANGTRQFTSKGTAFLSVGHLARRLPRSGPRCGTQISPRFRERDKVVYTSCPAASEASITCATTQLCRKFFNQKFGSCSPAPVFALYRSVVSDWRTLNTSCGDFTCSHRDPLPVPASSQLQFRVASGENSKAIEPGV
eukprot:g24342.t1